MKYLLDTSILGQLCHPRKFNEVKLWFRGVVGLKRHDVYLPEVVDFELRRELLHRELWPSLDELDRLPKLIVYLPITTAIMRDAAVLWAGLQKTGQPVGPPDALAADVILAAQAREIGAAVITDNVRHLSRMVPVAAWADL